MDVGAGHVCDEHVAGDGCVYHVVRDPVVLHTRLGARSGDESGVVGVVVVDVYDGVDSALDEVCEEELHVSGFVAAECEASRVFSLDEELRDGTEFSIHRLGDGGSESGHLLEGRVLARELDARDLGDGVEDGLWLHGLNGDLLDFGWWFVCPLCLRHFPRTAEVILPSRAYPARIAALARAPFAVRKGR